MHPKLEGNLPAFHGAKFGPPVHDDPHRTECGARRADVGANGLVCPGLFGLSVQWGERRCGGAVNAVSCAGVGLACLQGAIRNFESQCREGKKLESLPCIQTSAAGEDEEEKKLASVARTGGFLKGTACRWRRGQVRRRKWARSTLATAGKAVALLRSTGPRSIA